MIEINNLTTDSVNKKFFKKVIQKVLKGERRDKFELSVVLVVTKKIKELNKKYRKKNNSTDILSFTYNKYNSGEIVICPEVVKKNAKKYNSNFKKELSRVLIHGILHLLGYNHEKPSTRVKLGAGLVPNRNKVSGAGVKKEAEKMQKREKFYFESIF